MVVSQLNTTHTHTELRARARACNARTQPCTGSESHSQRMRPPLLPLLLLRAMCIGGVALASLPRRVLSGGDSEQLLGSDCFVGCGFKSGKCPDVCPTTARKSGRRLVYTSYNCCRRGWYPHGDCKINDGCIGRHCCVKGEESTQDPDAQASALTSAEAAAAEAAAAAGGQTNIADPTCTSGVVSQTGFVCSPASCGESDGSANCALRTGGDMCCSHKVLHTGGSCSLGPPPCVIEESQRSKRTTPCPAAGGNNADATLELSASLLQSYVAAAPSVRVNMPFVLEAGAAFKSGDQADVLDLTSATATVTLRKSYQPSTVDRNEGFSVCMWFKADRVLQSSQTPFFPLASKFIENKGWELRMTLQGRVSFRVSTELGPHFEAAVNLGSADAFIWHHACGIYYGALLSNVGILVDGSKFSNHFLPVGTAKYVPVTSVRDTRIGRSLGDPRLKFRGMIAGFKVWANKAIAIPDMQHIGGACGGGSNAASNVAIGAPVNLYQDKDGTGHRLTDTSKGAFSFLRFSVFPPQKWHAEYFFSGFFSLIFS